MNLLDINSKKPIVFVFAGNMREVEFYRHKEGLTRSQVLFITDPQRQLRARGPSDEIITVLIGSFWTRKDAEIIYYDAVSRGFEPKPVAI